MQCHFCHFPNSITARHRPIDRICVAAFVFVSVSGFVLFGTFQIENFSTSLLIHSHIPCTSGWEMLLLSTVYLSIIEWITEKRTRARAHPTTNIPHWFAFLWPMKEFLQAIIHGVYQLCLIWFDIVFIAFVSMVPYLEKCMLSSLSACNSPPPVPWISENCATQNRVVIIVICFAI